MLIEKSSRVFKHPLSLKVVFPKGLVSLNPFILDCQNTKTISLISKSLSIMNKHNYFLTKKFKLKNHLRIYNLNKPY